MMQKLPVILFIVLFITSCAYKGGEQGTISELDTVQMELKDVDVEGGLDKAMAGYQKFLEKTPESQLTPEAIRRLADLKIEKEYGVVTEENELSGSKSGESTEDVAVTKKAISNIKDAEGNNKKQLESEGSSSLAITKESEKDFEKRATESQKIESAKNVQLQLPKGEAGADLKNAGAEEAIRLYKKLLEKYPLYERNDQVLYQLSRAYEEIGQVDKAMMVMNRLVKEYPNSRYNDEVHFRRGEYYFTRKKYLDAEDAYGEVLKMGVGTVYYERALYKKGWTFYKQELYEEALQEYFELLDYKVSIGYDFEQTSDNIEKKRIDDTFRVVSLSFSNLGGSETIKEFFEKRGARDYEYYVYKELAEFYFAKRRYSDAAATYNTFADANPFHRKSPHYNMRVIEIYTKGGFPRLVIEAKKRYASTYGLEAEYWNYFNQADYPEVLGYLKTNITDLANHYHSLYQNKKFKKDKQQNFLEASHWYKEFLKSFPREEQSPAINYQLADLYLENRDFDLAAVEYEHSAYDYPVNDKSRKAAYATIYSYREHLKNAPVSQMKNVKREIIRTSLRLVDAFPDHEKVTVVLGAATDDLFEMRDFTLAIKTGRRLIDEYPNADAKIRRGAWLVVAHSSYEIEIYNDAEQAYIEVLALTAKDDKSRVQLTDNLAASIYKQGEKARGEENYREAVRHFLRIADVAPTSKIRPSAEYDAAAVLIQIMDLEQAVSVLQSFRSNYPGHELQKDVTKKIAFSYKELGKYGPAAQEYERVAAEADEEELVREAMLQSAELYEKAKDVGNSLRVYKQFVVKFPKPLEFALETYYKIAMIYKSQSDLSQYRKTLQHIIKTDATAGSERTDRTRYLAAQSSLVIIEPKYDEYISIRLVKPFKKSLKKKQKSMKTLVSQYTKLVDYEVADVTAASTFYIAEIYYNFNRSLIESERPDGLSDVELDEFNLMLDEQAYPFEEKTIQVHEKNIELLALGIHSPWIDRSIEKLARLLPARYDKPEEAISYISKIDNYIYSSPRYVREDATTGFIKSLGFFRYVSQNVAANHHNKSKNVDTVIRENVNEDIPGTVNPEPSEVHEAENLDQQVDGAGASDAAPSESTAEQEQVRQLEEVETTPTVSSETEQEVPETRESIEGRNVAEENPEKSMSGLDATSDDKETAQKNTENSTPLEGGAIQEPVEQQDAVEKPSTINESGVSEVKDNVEQSNAEAMETERPVDSEQTVNIEQESVVNDSVNSSSTEGESVQEPTGNIVQESLVNDSVNSSSTDGEPVQEPTGNTKMESGTTAENGNDESQKTSEKQDNLVVNEDSSNQETQQITADEDNTKKTKQDSQVLDQENNIEETTGNTNENF